MEVGGEVGSILFRLMKIYSSFWFCPLGEFRWESAEVLSSLAWTISWIQTSCLLPFKATAPRAAGAFCSFEPRAVLVYTDAGYGAISSSSDWHWQLFQRVCVKRVKLPLCWTNQSLRFLFQERWMLSVPLTACTAWQTNDSEFIKPKRLLKE